MKILCISTWEYNLKIFGIFSTSIYQHNTYMLFPVNQHIKYRVKQILDIFEKIKSGVRILLRCYGPHEFCNNKQAVLQQHHDSLRTAFKK